MGTQHKKKNDLKSLICIRTIKREEIYKYVVCETERLVLNINNTNFPLINMQFLQRVLFAREVLCHNDNLLLPDLPDHVLPVLTHDRTDHNSKQIWSTVA